MIAPRANSRSAAFSLVELLILVTAALVVAGLSVPVLRGLALSVNEESAVETLTRLRDFQIRYREKGVSTLPSGRARFGTFTELLRGGLSLEDAVPREDGQLLLRHGYLFQFHFATRSRDFTNNPADADAADSKDGFVVYAWPETWGRSGSSVFAIDPSGILRPSAKIGTLESRNLLTRYSGVHRAPQAFAALRVSPGGRPAVPPNGPAGVPPVPPGSHPSTLPSSDPAATAPESQDRNGQNPNNPNPTNTTSPASAAKIDLRGERGEDGETWEVIPLPPQN